MRVDKYLWCVRYFKTRTIATEACKKGHVKIRDESVKPSREVFPGETLQVRKNQINYVVEVIDVPKSRVGAKLTSIYCIDKTPADELERFELVKSTQDYYRKKGVGRPTKKDRREIDDFLDDDEVIDFD